MKSLITWEEFEHEMQEAIKNGEDPFNIICKLRRVQKQPKLIIKTNNLAKTKSRGKIKCVRLIEL